MQGAPFVFAAGASNDAVAVRAAIRTRSKSAAAVGAVAVRNTMAKQDHDSNHGENQQEKYRDECCDATEQGARPMPVFVTEMEDNRKLTPEGEGNSPAQQAEEQQPEDLSRLFGDASFHAAPCPAAFVCPSPAHGIVRGQSYHEGS